jgi:hypothetical protein
MYVGECEVSDDSIAGVSSAEYCHRVLHLSLDRGIKLHRYFRPMRLIRYILNTSK